MAKALDEKLKIAIADLTHNPDKWNSYYLPKLNQFETKIKSLPEEDPNYLYVKTVIGVEATIDRPRQDGIINRFWKKMQDVVREEMEKQKQQQQQQQQQTLAADFIGDRILPETNTNQTNSHNNPILTDSATEQEVIEVEIENTINTQLSC